MASSVTKVIAGSGLAFFLTFNPAVADGGTVSFSGALTQDPCRVTPENNQLTVSCFNQGKLQTQQISVQQAVRGEVTLPGVAKVSLKYLNPQKSLAVVRVDYN